MKACGTILGVYVLIAIALAAFCFRAQHRASVVAWTMLLVMCAVPVAGAHRPIQRPSPAIVGGAK